MPDQPVAPHLALAGPYDSPVRAEGRETEGPPITQACSGGRVCIGGRAAERRENKHVSVSVRGRGEGAARARPGRGQGAARSARGGTLSGFGEAAGCGRGVFLAPPYLSQCPPPPLGRPSAPAAGTRPADPFTHLSSRLYFYAGGAGRAALPNAQRPGRPSGMASAL